MPMAILRWCRTSPRKKSYNDFTTSYLANNKSLPIKRKRHKRFGSRVIRKVWDKAHSNQGARHRMRARPRSPIRSIDGIGSAYTKREEVAVRLAKMESAVRTLLECIGEDTKREGLKDTPSRYAKALLFLTKGYQSNVNEVINGALFHGGHNQMIIVKNIDISSLCEHHLVPFTGKIHIGYIPSKMVIGLSKIARIAEIFSRRLQIQERLTEEVAQAIMDILTPQGVAVVMESSHMCMVIRGVEKTSSTTLTRSVAAVMPITEQISVERLKDGRFVSKFTPVQFGNLRATYGGNTIGVAFNAASQTVPPGFSAYSILGHFLGPALKEHKLYCKVHDTRTTRTFATRRVEVSQEQTDGTFRTCLELIADFHASEPSMLEFSARPTMAWPKPRDCPDRHEYAQGMLDRGEVNEAQMEEFRKSFDEDRDYFETRICTGGMAAQNLTGIAGGLPTTQDTIPVTSRVSAEWLRARGTFATQAENIAALAFIMDGTLAFLALTHNHLWVDAAGPCGSLDFALRILAPQVKMGDWNLRERVVHHSGSGRTFAEGRLFDEQGKLLASMTQQCFMRVPRNEKSGSKI
ncbi:unnamed protein product [Clonostachys rosea f. rosea IK726]|uniref:Uncharacterized protein n=1 Tax=Clonostachys rosea f. rosea IK726 TaxID=1349383 RepID=A0ACA9TMZ7_BIOOC|nr:unnamed protein product [Clonostachys rosea f. rosea IK726]